MGKIYSCLFLILQKRYAWDQSQRLPAQFLSLLLIFLACVQATGIAQTQAKDAIRAAGFFIGDSAVVVLSVLLILARMVALQRTIKTDPGATFAKFGVPGALLGISIKVVGTITLSISKSALA